MNCSGRNDSAIIIALVLVCFGALTADAQTTTFDPHETANQVSNKVASKFGSSDGIRQNAVNPMTAGGGPMTNINGTTSFNAPLVICPASKKFLDVSIVTGNTGDIAGVYVQQDTDFDGIFDYAYSSPVVTSGVCGNGVISCDAGTWNNCRHFKWVAGSDGRAGLQEVEMQNLGGCFCVNNSCGSGLVLNQLNYVLSTLGGGVVGAVQAVNPQWAVSNAGTADMTISYYGQNSDQCAAPPAPMSSGTPNPEQYFGSPSSLEGAARTEVSAQLSNPGSSYNSLLSLSEAAASKGSYGSCAIKRSHTVTTVSVQSDTRCAGNPTRYLGDAIWSADNGCDNVVSNFNRYDIPCVCDSGYDGFAGGCSCESYKTFCRGGGLFGWGGQGCSASPYRYNPMLSMVQGQSVVVRMVKTAHDGYQRSQGGFGVMLDDWKEPSGSYIYHWAWPGGDLGWAVGEAYARMTSDIPISQTRDHTFYIWSFLNDPLSLWECSYVDIRKYWCIVKEDRLSPETINNGCVGYEGNANCSLKEETVDGVTTFINYNPTGFVPTSSCRSFTGEVESFNVCADWWEKNRTYFCRSDSFYDLSRIKERAANISNTASAGSGSFSYQDKTPNSSGGWDYSANTVSADTAGGSSSCMTACKTRKPASNTQASLNGTTAQSNVSTSSWEFFYKTCAASVCPVGDGEEILTDCQCIDEFAEAATIMETMNHAAKDLICSNGNLQ